MGGLAAPVWARPLVPQRAHRRVLLPAGAGSDCSRPASVIGNRWMGGGRRPALPPVAILTGAGREGEREEGKRGRLGPRGRLRARLPSAARACPGAGLGLAEARAGTGGRKLKPAARRKGGRLGRGGGEWVLVCLRAQKYESCRGFSKEDVRGETPGHPSNVGSFGRAGSEPRAPECARARGVGRGLRPLSRRFRETRAALRVGSRLVVCARRRWGRGGARRWGVAGARHSSPCRLWVPRNFRTLPESF